MRLSTLRAVDLRNRECGAPLIIPSIIIQELSAGTHGDRKIVSPLHQLLLREQSSPETSSCKTPLQLPFVVGRLVDGRY